MLFVGAENENDWTFSGGYTVLGYTKKLKQSIFNFFGITIL